MSIAVGAAIMGGMQALQGLGNIKTSKGIARQSKKLTEAKRKTAQKQHEWNAQDIAESFEDNYVQLMYGYAQNISQQYAQHRQANADNKTSLLASAGAVDLSGSSALGTTSAKIDQELSDNISMMFENERRAVESLVDERNKQYYQNDNMLSQTNMQYQIEDAQTSYNKEMQRQQGIMDVISGGLQVFDAVSGSKSKPKTNTDTSKLDKAPKAEQSLYNALQPSGSKLTLSSRWG